MFDSFDIAEDVGETGLIRDDVYLKVRADILTCTLMPGSLLQEKDLAERYSVGRSPVRDALLRLQEQGLVKILPRKGYRVLPISLGDAQDLYDMRILLEKECIKRLNKFICEGPWYLLPLIDGADIRSDITLVTEPEKLLQRQASFTNLTTSAFGKQL